MQTNRRRPERFEWRLKWAMRWPGGGEHPCELTCRVPERRLEIVFTCERPSKPICIYKRTRFDGADVRSLLGDPSGDAWSDVRAFATDPNLPREVLAFVQRILKAQEAQRPKSQGGSPGKGLRDRQELVREFTGLVTNVLASLPEGKSSAAADLFADRMVEQLRGEITAEEAARALKAATKAIREGRTPPRAQYEAARKRHREAYREAFMETARGKKPGTHSGRALRITQAMLSKQGIQIGLDHLRRISRPT